MNERMDQCCLRLKEELKTVEKSLEDAGHHLASATDAGVDALEERLKTSLSVVGEKRGEALQAAQRVRQFVEETKDAAISRYEDWKTDREIGKIEKEADEREAHAVDAIVTAAFALREAEVAIMEALRARKIAIEVAG